MEIGSASDSGSGSGELQPQRDEEIEGILKLEASIPYKERKKGTFISATVTLF